MVLKETFSFLPLLIWRTFFHHKEYFVKQKGSSDVKGSLWNHLDKKDCLWHHELSTFIFKSMVHYMITEEKD